MLCAAPPTWYAGAAALLTLCHTRLAGAGGRSRVAVQRAQGALASAAPAEVFENLCALIVAWVACVWGAAVGVRRIFGSRRAGVRHVVLTEFVSRSGTGVSEQDNSGLQSIQQYLGLRKVWKFFTAAANRLAQAIHLFGGLLRVWHTADTPMSAAVRGRTNEVRPTGSRQPRWHSCHDISDV